MSNFKRYKKYYPVNYDYVDELPEGWKLLPNIAVFQERIERGFVDEELLSVTISKGVIKQSDLAKKDSSTLDKSKYLLVYPGDLVYSMRFRQGASGYSTYKGIVSPACTVLKPKRNVKIIPKYFHYMFKTGFYKNYVERFAYGIADGQIPLRYVDFKRMYSIVPPLETQNTIVKYLDRKTKQIEEFISKKERLIELLEEKINVLIFKEINSSKYGMQRKKLKYVSFLSRGVDLSNENFKKGNYPVYGSNGIIGYHNKYTTEGPCVTVGRSGSVGEVNFVEKDFWAHNTTLYVCRNYKNDWKFIYYLMVGLDFKSYAAGSAVGTLNRNNIHQIYVNIPSIDAQKIIVKKIEKKSFQLHLAISKAQTEIKKLKEYRESLITNAVTGKIKIPACDSDVTERK